MTFEREWALFFLLVPLVWFVFEWRRTRRAVALVLKALALTVIVVALADPRLAVNETKVAVSVLVDTSDSVPSSDLRNASQFVNSVERARGRNTVRVLPFAREIRQPTTSETANGWHFANTSGEPGHATGLESSLRAAIAGLPAGLVQRLVLISDGKENTGTITRVAWQASNLQIPIDVVPLQGREESGIALQQVSTPLTAFTGERFPVDLVVTSPRAASATLVLSAEGKPLGTQTVQLSQGENHLPLHAALSTAGALNLSGSLSAGDLGSVQFDRALSLRKPRVLYISQDPEGSGKHLLDTLAAGQFEVTSTNDPLQAKLADYQIAVLNNIDLHSLADARKSELEAFVKAGGGLLIIGGEHNVYAENKGPEDALDRALPATLAPPRSPEGTGVILIIDKSSSMEGKKIELARLAAIGVVDNLRPIDQVGVLIFDNSFQWAVPLRRAEDKPLIKRLISGISPDGGTQIAPALAEAYHKILPARSAFKHIVLLTDGISEEGDSIDLAKDALAQHVTISTVGLGQDVNRAYLEKVANTAGGKAYFLNDPSGLEQIVLKDVMEHTGSTTVEKELKPVVAHKAELLDQTGIESAPALKGYVKFTSKPSADTLVTIDEHDPLFVHWQYGLGRSAVFTSDAKSRWAADWVNWKGFDRLWTNIFRDLLPHAQEGEAKAEFDTTSGDLIFDYRLSPGMEEPKKAPEIFVLGPNHFQRPMELTKVADRAFRARVHIGELQGLFRARPLAEQRAFPEIGYYVPEQELLDRGSNQFLLKQLATYTGGRFNPSPAQIFDTGGRSRPSSMRLWPLLLALAIALNLTELVLRKFQRLAAW